MLKKYFRVAGPNEVTHRSYTLINLVGLAFGICICIIIFLVTDYKLSFDRFDSCGNRAYQIDGTIQSGLGLTEFLNADGNEVTAIKDQAPGFELKDDDLCKLR
jgi:hypothetical protein